MANNNTNWIALLSRARKAYQPSFAQRTLLPFSQNFGQGISAGLVQRQTTQDALRQAILSEMLKQGQFTTPEGQPATMEQTFGYGKQPGLISRLLGAKPVELTYEPRPEKPKELGYRDQLLKDFIETGVVPTTFKGRENQFYKAIGVYVSPTEEPEEKLPVDWTIWQQAIKEATDLTTKEIDINFARKRYRELTKVFIPGRQPLPAPVEKPLEEYTNEELLKTYNELLGK
jgi:hypothetical protein